MMKQQFTVTANDVTDVQERYRTADGQDDRASAASRLEDFARFHGRDDVFPFRDRHGWVTKLETKVHNGRQLISKSVSIHTGCDECPECGNTRRRISRRDNGAVSGVEESCTVCDHVFVSQHG